MPFRALLLTLAALLAAATPASAQTTLTADAPAIPYHTVLHLSAAHTLGDVTFFDGITPIATLPQGVQGYTVLAVATLTPGPHTLIASSANGPSNPVQVTVALAPAPFLITSNGPLVYAQSTVNLAAQGLPPKATGTLTWSQDGVVFATPILTPNTPLPTYYALGDSITAGAHLTNLSARYPDLFAAARGFGTYYYNLADSGAIACDTLASDILRNQVDPTQDASPLYSLMIGSTDMDNFGTPHGEPNFIACHLAALAWLGIPREFKVLPADPGTTILSGAWQLPPAQLDSTYVTLYNSTGSGAASFQVTSGGGPLYLWYLLGDHIAGAFNVSLDGVPTGTTYNTNPANRVGSFNNPDSTGFALLRFPVAPGPHTLRVDIVSGTVGLLAAATPPSPGAASVHPTVLATDVPNQNFSQAEATPATIQQFSSDALANIALLAADGLDLRTVPTHDFLGTSAAEFFDFAHPSILGHQHLADAFTTAFPLASTTPYLTYSASFPRESPIAQTPGSHTFTVQYSGDATYAPSTASTTIQVIPAGQSVTSLSLPATTFYAAQPVTATATIFPPNPGASVALMQSGQVLATSTIAADNTAGFSLQYLSPGLHTLYAAYAGTSSAAASVSPPITIRNLKNVSTLTLTGPAASLPYAEPITLSALAQPANATGTVTFTDTYTPNGQSASTIALGQIVLSGGPGTLTLGPLAPGTHTFTAAYAGDSYNNSATSAPAVTVIGLIPTATTLAAAPAVYGKASTFTATVSPADATGTLTFIDLTANTATQLTAANGTATWTISTLTPGPHNLVATYAGDATHAPSTSVLLTAVIARDPSTITLTASLSTPSVGDPVTLTVTVSPAAATGTVLFSDPTAGTLGQASVLNGTATLTLAAPPAGTYAVTAAYAGDPNTLPSTSTPAAFQVLSRATSLTLAAPLTTPYGTIASFTATISPAPAAGLIQFSENGNLLGSITIKNGAATFTTSSLTPGLHTLTAAYAGSALLDHSDGTATITITPAASVTSLSLAQPSVLAGSQTTVNVRITTASSTPTGTVLLRSGGTTLASASVANSTPGAAYATLTFPANFTGTFPLTALYSGDPDTAASDAAGTYTVLPRIAAGTLTLSATQVPPQTPVTLTAKFTSPASSGPALIPTGTVAFSNGSNLIANVALDPAGQATATLPQASIGTYTLTAVYIPTGVFTAAPVPSQTLSVTAPLAIAFPSPSLTLSAGATADTTAAYTPLSGFQGAVATQCTTDAPYLTCTLDAPTTLWTAATAHIHLAVARTTSALPATVMLACLLPTLLLARRRRFAPLLILLVAIGLNGCATGGNFNQVPPGTHVLTLTATAANTPTTATLTVIIQ